MTYTTGAGAQVNGGVGNRTDRRKTLNNTGNGNTINMSEVGEDSDGNSSDDDDDDDEDEGERRPVVPTIRIKTKVPPRPVPTAKKTMCGDNLIINTRIKNF